MIKIQAISKLAQVTGHLQGLVDVIQVTKGVQNPDKLEEFLLGNIATLKEVGEYVKGLQGDKPEEKEKQNAVISILLNEIVHCPIFCECQDTGHFQWHSEEECNKQIQRMAFLCAKKDNDE